MSLNPKIYLAGPDVFIKNSTIGERKKAACRQLGFDALYPLDNEISGQNAALEIYKANCLMIDQADIVLANVSPFRSPHCDVGTSFEIGYAIALGKPVYTYSNDTRTLIDRIKEDSPAMLEDGTHVEDFGLNENLMLGIGSTLPCFTRDERTDLSAWQAFNDAIKAIKAIQGK